MDIEKLIKNLRLRGHSARFFNNGEEAVNYLSGQISNTQVGIGGSQTVKELGLYEALSENNAVYWHWVSKDEATREKANVAPVYISGINALSEDGEIVNIDGTGNRVAAQSYGRKRCYFIAGINKICPDLSSTIDRARNVAAVENAKRFDWNIPCRKDGKCHNCLSPERICRALLVLLGPVVNMETEVILINEELGY